MFGSGHSSVPIASSCISKENKQKTTGTYLDTYGKMWSIPCGDVGERPGGGAGGPRGPTLGASIGGIGREHWVPFGLVKCGPLWIRAPVGCGGGGGAHYTESMAAGRARWAGRLRGERGTTGTHCSRVCCSAAWHWARVGNAQGCISAPLTCSAACRKNAIGSGVVPRKRARLCGKTGQRHMTATEKRSFKSPTWSRGCSTWWRGPVRPPE